jgi:hypothetical protein
MTLSPLQTLGIILAVAAGTQLTRWLPFWLFPETGPAAGGGVSGQGAAPRHDGAAGGYTASRASAGPPRPTAPRS